MNFEFFELQVYSHYILSVLLDGVDNEFLIDTSSSDPHRGHSQGKRQEATRASKRNRSKPKNLRSTASTTKNQHPGGLLDSSLDSDDTATSDDSSWGVDEGEGDKCEIAKAFEKRKMAVVTYLNRLAYEVRGERLIFSCYKSSICCPKFSCFLRI